MKIKQIVILKPWHVLYGRVRWKLGGGGRATQGFSARPAWKGNNMCPVAG